jgi:hypothetical protein
LEAHLSGAVTASPGMVEGQQGASFRGISSSQAEPPIPSRPSPSRHCKGPERSMALPWHLGIVTGTSNDGGHGVRNDSVVPVCPEGRVK